MAKNINRNIAIGYLAALIDGEGSISCNSPHRRQISICNTDQAILNFASKCLDVLQIKHSVRLRNKTTTTGKSVWYLYICNKNGFERIFWEVPLQSIKRDKLEYMVNSYTQPQHNLDKQKVNEMYHIEKMSSIEIAKILKVGRGTIHNLIDNPRTHAQAQALRKRKTNGQYE